MNSFQKPFKLMIALAIIEFLYFPNPLYDAPLPPGTGILATYRVKPMSFLDHPLPPICHGENNDEDCIDLKPSMV
jgi:hypothetical protein